MSYATDFSKGQTVTSVSAEWARRPDDQKFLNLSDMLAFKRNLFERSEEEAFSLDKARVMIGANDEHALGLEINGRAFQPNNWSFSQLCSAAGAPRGYLSKLPAPIAAAALQIGLSSEASNAKALVTGSGLRAVTSERYGRIWDHQVIEDLMKVAGNGDGDTRWKVPGHFDWSTANYGGPGNSRATYNPDVPVTKETTTLFASDRDIYTFLCDDKNPVEVGKLADGSPDLMFRGFILWNSEVGARTLGLATMYLRGVCCNRILWGVEQYQEMTMRHTDKAPQQFIGRVMPTFESYANASTQKLLDGVKAAKARKVADDDDDARDFLCGGSLGFSQVMAAKVIRTVEEEEGTHCRTIWDMAQGITAVARGIHHQDDRLDMERKARVILDGVLA